MASSKERVDKHLAACCLIEPRESMVELQVVPNTLDGKPHDTCDWLVMAKFAEKMFYNEHIFSKEEAEAYVAKLSGKKDWTPENKQNWYES